MCACLTCAPGLALNVEFIDPDEARAAASAKPAAVSSKSAAAVAPVSSDPPALLIHAMRAGKRAVTSAGVAAEPTDECNGGQVSHISDLFKSTRALPTIYYKERERGAAKRPRAGDTDKSP